MIKMRNLTGMPVVMDGRKIGRLIQAELSQDLRRLRCIWIDAGIKGMRCIPSENLEMIGSKAVTADSAGIRSRCRAALPLLRAVSTDGRRLGAVTGAEIDELTFAVQALEISGGLWDDLYRGRRRIAASCIHLQGNDVILQEPADKSDKEDET